MAMVVLSIATSVRAGIAPKDASYFCIAEFVGGLRYNERTRKWEGAAFEPSDKFAKFVMRMKHLRSETRKDVRGKHEPAQVFDVTLIVAGSSVAYPCLNWREPSRSIVFGGDAMEFDCFGAFHGHQFNLEHNRFLSTYLEGYLGGADNNKDTPSVSGGVCKKID